MSHDDTERTTRYRDMTPLSSSLIAQGAPHNLQRNALIDALKGYRFDSALEVGCNVGTVIARVRAEFGVRCSGFDFNEQAVRYAMLQHPDISFWVLDAEDMADAYRTGGHDLIFTSGTLMHCGPKLFALVCRGILALQPKLILHHEPQGPEELLRELTLGEVWRASRYEKSPLPEKDDDDIVYFQRRHDYVGFYREAGVPAEHIHYDSTKPVLSQCDEVVVVLDPEAVKP